MPEVGFILRTSRTIRPRKSRILMSVIERAFDSNTISSEEKLIFGIIFNFLYAFFWYMHPKPWGYLLASLWIGFQIAFFYWYWHTKEDPLGDFEFKSYVKKNEI